MEDNQILPNCGDEDVLSFNDTMFKIGKFRDALNRIFREQVPTAIETTLKASNINLQATNSKYRIHGWFGNGENQSCEVLKVGSKGWKKGKIKVCFTIEFIPDEPNEPESPLDDIRRTIREDDL